MNKKYVLSPKQRARKSVLAKARWASRTSEQKAKDKEHFRKYDATHRAQINAKHRDWYAAHPEVKPKKLAYALFWQAAHREEILAARRRRYAENRERECKRAGEWKARHRDKGNAYARHWRKANPVAFAEMRKRNHFRRKKDLNYRLAGNLRKRLGRAIRTLAKKGSAVKDLGCSIEELKCYLESRFQPGMTWENWSMTGWHIDHVKPLASFDLTDEVQFKEACHYTNLQPLWACDNFAKNRKIA